MEEVDKIIIHSLKDIGCVIDDEVDSLENFTTDIVIDATVRCLEIIHPETNISRTLPQNMAARFHLGSAIAETCKSVGYNGEVGYQTFLYLNVGDVRRVFMFLIEKLPREVEKTSLEPDDPLTKLKSEIGSEIKKCLAVRRKPPSSKSNIPFLSSHLETGIIGPRTKLSGNPKDWREYVINELPFLTEQVTERKLLPSIIALNAQGLCLSSGTKSKEVTPSPSLNDFSHEPLPPHKHPDSWLSINQSLLFSRELQSVKSDDIEKNDNANDLSVDKLNLNENINNSLENEETVDHIRVNIEELQTKIRGTNKIIEKISEECEREAKLASERSKEMSIHQKAFSLLPESEKNLEELEHSVTALSERILSLSGKWESYRKPLVDEFISARSEIAQKENQNAEEYDKIKQLKAKIEELNKHLIGKRGIIVQLEEEFDKLPKNINRSAYTRRIMEIIGNISKQKDQIEKILSDTKELQKEINSLNGRLERLFAVTEESIYRNARKDEFSKRSFKLLATLHSDCGTIGSLVLEIGTITREITDLNEQIEVESRKNTTANLERISADLEQMRAESKSLKNQIHKLQTSVDIPSHPLL